MELELHVADVVDDHKIKMEKMRLKIRKSRKYAIDSEAWYHYAVGSIVTLVAILIQQHNDTKPHYEWHIF